MSWLRSSSPALLPSRQAQLARGTLLAWLLVLVVGLFSPWVQARDMEPLCSGAGHVQWVPGPQVDGLAHAMHGLDCPLCMPQLAAPPPAVRPQCGALPPAVHPRRLPAVAWTPMPSACPPPGRGPPWCVMEAIAGRA